MDDATEQELQRELAECVMQSSWFCCVAGVTLSIPMCIKLKSYNPVVYMGLGGTMLDLLRGYDKCLFEREALEEYQAAIKARQQQHNGGEQLDRHLE